MTNNRQMFKPGDVIYVASVPYTGFAAVIEYISDSTGKYYLVDAYHTSSGYAVHEVSVNEVFEAMPADFKVVAGVKEPIYFIGKGDSDERN